MFASEKFGQLDKGPEIELVPSFQGYEPYVGLHQLLLQWSAAVERDDNRLETTPI
jgi:hypothetical protein